MPSLSPHIFPAWELLHKNSYETAELKTSLGSGYLHTSVCGSVCQAFLPIRALHPKLSPGGDTPRALPFNRSTEVPTKPQCMSFNVHPKLFHSDASPLLWVLAWELYEGLQKNSWQMSDLWIMSPHPSFVIPYKCAGDHYHGWLLQYYTLIFALFVTFLYHETWCVGLKNQVECLDHKVN